MCSLIVSAMRISKQSTAHYYHGFLSRGLSEKGGNMPPICGHRYLHNFYLPFPRRNDRLVGAYAIRPYKFQDLQHQGLVYTQLILMSIALISGIVTRLMFMWRDLNDAT
jgi:hypothetical protein